MSTPAIPFRFGRLGLSLAAGALLGLGLSAPTSLRAETLRTIAINGNLDDWTEVLLDADQTVADRSLAQGDPDAPGQAQRDERGVAVTWNATNLYLYFTRTGGGTNQFNAIFYMDVGHDRLLSATDYVLFFRFTGSSFTGCDLVRYADGGTPDVMTGDGATPAGGVGAAVSTTGANAAGDATGIRFEATIPWARLGVPAGTPMFIHPSLSTNQNLPGGVEDNCELLDTFLPGVSLSGGGTQGTAPGRSVDFAHVMANTGSATDTVNLSAHTLLGFDLSLHSDPDGDGDPGDGVLWARDANGDGDFTDIADTRPVAAVDADSNDQPDGGALAADASRSIVLRIGVPPGQALGTQETVRLFATSAYRPAVRREVTDRVRVGLITVTPPGATLATSNYLAQFSHAGCNDSGLARTLDLDVSSAEGWLFTLMSDPDGDGNPTDGMQLTDTDGDGLPDLGVVADADCAAFVVLVSVPAGTPAGTQDTLSVVLRDGALTASATDAVDAVGARVDVAPDRTVTTQQGKTIYLAHVVTNAANVADSFTLSTSSTLGSATATLDDPDGDGEPSDSVVIANTGVVELNGGQASIIARIRVPAMAAHGAVDTVTIRGTSDASGVSETAQDVVTVAGLLTYSDALFARPTSAFFGQCATVFALAYRSGGGTYRFVWLNAMGTIVRTGPDITPYADESLDDFFDLGSAPAQGLWTVKLQLKSGSSYSDVGPSGTRTFDVMDLVTAGARVDTVETGADLYQVTGDDFAGIAEVVDPTNADILDSVIEHVVFRDSNGDGIPTAGEDLLRADGTVAAWAPGSFTARLIDVDVFTGESYGDRFDVPAADFVTFGVWTLQTTWTASCGFLLDVNSIDFTVGCQPAPTFAGIASADDADSCSFDGIRLTWNVATSWGAGTSGTYAIYRSTDPGFVPDDATLLVAGLGATFYFDATAAPNVTYYYVVLAESDVSCSTGPNNDGLLDDNRLRHAAEDIVVGDVPVADFTVTGTGCFDGTSALLDFDDVSTGPALVWAWDLDGDGSIDSTGRSPSFVYTAPGTYMVRLDVVGACGADGVTIPVDVTMVPTADVTVDRASTCVGEAVVFDATGSTATLPATITDWLWDFDGDTVVDFAGADPGAVFFGAPGTRDVSLTVRDSFGCEHADSVSVRVYDALTSVVAVPIVDHCTGNVTVTASASGGNAPYFYQWDVLADDGTGTGRATLPPGTSTTATVTVIDASGCTVQRSSVPIVVNPQLTLALSSPTVDQCAGTVMLQADFTGGDGSYVVLFDGAPGIFVGPGRAVVLRALAPGMHDMTVEVIDGAGCRTSVTTAPFEVRPLLVASFTSAVVYVYPDVFQATVTMASVGGTGAVSTEWDVMADGSIDGTGASLGFPMGANETIPVEVRVTDENGCVSVMRADVLSAGCPAVSPLRMLMVRKVLGGVGFDFGWEPSTDPCHGRYELIEAVTARPSTDLVGAFPTDPAWSFIQPQDADGSDLDPAFRLADARTGIAVLYYLVRDGGTDGTWAPTGHYDDM